MRFADGSVEPADAIIFATGYRISFPFFDPDFISAPGNVLPLYKRMFKPGIDDLAFIGLGQAIPTIFPFAECQAKLAARWLAGDWALPERRAEMEAEIRRDERLHVQPLLLAPAPHHGARLLRLRVRPAQAGSAGRPGPRAGPGARSDRVSVALRRARDGAVTSAGEASCRG